MIYEAPLKPHKGSSTNWNSWIVIFAIPIVVAVIVIIEVNIRRLICHSVLPK